MLPPIAYGLAIALDLLILLIGGRFLERRAAVRQLTPRRATTT